jgi:capsular polysaccharide biosynthesis protein
MELKQLWAVVMRRWWLILLPAAVALILAIPSLKSVISPPHDSNVTIRFTASQVPNDQNAQTFQDKSYIPWLASEYAVTNLAAWMRTDSFAREVSQVLAAQNVTIEPDAVRGLIQSDSARSIMTLYVTGLDEAQIKAVAGAAVEVLQKRNAAYFPQFGADGATIIPLDTILVNPVAPQLAARFAPLARILIGLAAGFALAFLAEYLDATIRDRREAEALDLPVLAEIPRH